MEIQTMEVEFATTATDVDTTAIVELAANELALVGGGTANVSFL